MNELDSIFRWNKT